MKKIKTAKDLAFSLSIFSFAWAGLIFITILIPLILGHSMSILAQALFVLCIIVDFIKTGFNFLELKNEAEKIEREEKENAN